MEFLLLASFGEIMTYVLYVLVAVLILLLMITVHEFGHYVAGKIFDFGIEEFAIGFGPKIFSKTKKDGEVFSVRVLPLGGFCAFKGEDEDDPDPSAFNNKKPWQRIIVLISGALMNYLLALIVIGLMFGIYGHTAIMAYETSKNPEYGAEYSFADRDVILKADGKNVYLVTDLMDALEGHRAGDEVTFDIIRQGERQNVTVKLRADAEFVNVEDMVRLCEVLGVSYAAGETGEVLSTGFRITGVRLGFFHTLGRTFEYSFKLAGTIFTVIGQLFSGALGLNAVGGTVTTISVTAEAIRAGGLWSLLNITAFIGVNLAVFNLLPVPALDGSRAIFTLIEWIRKKPINRRVEGIIHAAGFVIIILFAIFVDVQQCF